LNVAMQAWDLQYEYFSSLKEYTCVAFDNRGVGWSDCPTGRYTTSDMAKDTFELLLWIGWKEDIHVVGVSMGGMIAEELCILAPDIVASLTLTSTYAGLAIPPTGAMYHIPRLLMTSDPVARLETLRDLLFPPYWLNAPSSRLPGKSNREAVTQLLVERAAKSRPPNPAGALGQLMAVTSHYVSGARLKVIVDHKIPVLVCTGTWDNLIDPANSTYLAKVLNAHTFKVFHGAGHAIATEHPVEYNSMLKTFIEDVDIQRAHDKEFKLTEAAGKA
ncbi:hypothetical protein HDU76_008973, partial [Blyttiomyces sp. JEL0837]